MPLAGGRGRGACAAGGRGGRVLGTAQSICAVDWVVAAWKTVVAGWKTGSLQTGRAFRWTGWVQQGLGRCSLAGRIQSDAARSSAMSIFGRSAGPGRCRRATFLAPKLPQQSRVSGPGVAGGQRLGTPQSTQRWTGSRSGWVPGTAQSMGLVGTAQTLWVG